MFVMESDSLGKFVTVCCSKCHKKDIRVKCKDKAEVDSWNQDLEEGVGSGLCIKMTTLCDDCEEKERFWEDYWEKQLDASYQELVYDEEKVYY